MLRRARSAQPRGQRARRPQPAVAEDEIVCNAAATHCAGPAVWMASSVTQAVHKMQLAELLRAVGLHAGLAKMKAMPDHEIYPITAEQLAEWKKSAEPLHQVWAEAVKKVGGDPDTIMKELRAELAANKAGY